MESKKQLNLLLAIAEAVPEERGGSIGSSGYDFQKIWGVAKIIELADKEEEFLLVFDYHEDTILLDGIEESEKIVFFQIKQKETGNWTHGFLTKRTKTTNSILAKLLKMKDKFPDGVGEFRFVTNAPFSVKLVDEADNSIVFDEICFSSIDGKILKQVETKLKEELEIFEVDKLKDHIFYEKTKLPLVSTDSACIGFLDKFLSSKFPGHSFRASDFYQTLLSEVKKKTNNKYVSHTPEWIKVNKSISSVDFDQFLKSADQIKAPLNQWSEISHILEELGEIATDIYRLKNEWQSLYLDIVQEKEIHSLVAKEIRRLLIELSKGSSLDKRELFLEALSKYKSTRVENVYSDDSIRLMVIYEYCK